jgi:hypothetical protein
VVRAAEIEDKVVQAISENLASIKNVKEKGAAALFPTGLSWCGRWDSNPHDVAIEGF